MSRATIYHGNCIDVLRELPSESVHCVVTSPPYFGLRDYSTAQWEGGDEECEHKPSKERLTSQFNAHSNLTGLGTQAAAAIQRWYKNGACRNCGARRIDAQIGLEPTPEEYVAKMVEVFREARRVLRDDGTLWLNMGDSYGTGTTARRQDGQRGIGVNTQIAQDAVPRIGGQAKQLLGMPWRLALALQSDVWILRSDIIWHKPNPMPESVTDRPTKSHEYIFLLSKDSRYYYDAEAIREPHADTEYTRDRYKYKPSVARKHSMNQDTNIQDDDFAQYFLKEDGKRNKRSVWTVATKSFTGAHFATFPPDLIKPCILAGCPEGGTVLDPFNGAGTTGLVALRRNRNYIGIELNAEYVEMARQRIIADAPMFNEVEVLHP